LKGAKINITNGAVLVVSNSAPNAITRTSGHIISEGENNRIRWNIGTTSGAYTIPWGSGNLNYFPLSFSTGSATGNGYLLLSTMGTAAENSTTLPSGIAHFNGNTNDDMSLVAVDRFWKIDAQSFTDKPTLTGLIFTYTDAEFASPNINSVESKLTARRWNASLNTWTDYNTGATVNTTANTITVSTLSGANLYPWWTMAYPGTTFHWIASSTSNWNNAANWSSVASGPGGLGIPGPGDAVWFDADRDGACSIDMSPDVAHITVSSGYSGAIALGNNSMAISNQADLFDGTFVSGGGTITINGSLNVSGGVFTAPTGILDVKRNMNFVSGSFNHNNGTVRFSGTTGVQQITGSSTQVFNNIEVTNTSANPGLRVESNVNLGGVLSLGANVTVDADGIADNKILTLLSTADNPTKDAAIGILPSGASVSGKVTVQRFMSIEGPSGGRIYRYIASPVQHGTVSDLQQEIPVTGTFTGTSVCSSCGTNQSMFSYRESIITDTNGNGVNTADDGYIDFPDVSNIEEMVPGRGYSVFVRGNTLASAKWDLRGQINAGNVSPVSLDVSYTSSGNAASDGWNLVGNPFPSTIDWNATGWTKTNMMGSIYTRDNGNTTGRFATWNGVVGTNGGSRYITTGQAFWVKADGAGVPVLQVNENVKSPGTQAIFFREEAPANVLRLTLVQGAVTDEAVIHFRQDASSGFDPGADALKMLNSGMNLSTRINGNEKLVINSLSALSCNITTEILIENVTKGNYTLNFSEMQTFPATTTIVLTDAFTGTTVDINARNSYNFSITDDVRSSVNTRFSLNIIAQPVNTEFSAQAAAVCYGNDAMITLEGKSTEVIYTAFMNNENIATLNPQDVKAIRVMKGKLQKGANDIVVRATPLQCGNSTEGHVMLNVIDVVSPTSVSAGEVCREGVVSLTASGADEQGTYRWYGAPEDSTPITESSSASFNTPPLKKSRYYYVSIANALGCEGERVAAYADVIQYDDANIELIGDSLVVNHTDGVQWFLNDIMIEGAQNPSIFPETSGIYHVMVSKGSCLTESVFDFVRAEEVTGVESSADHKINIYPNPVATQLSIELSATLDDVTAIYVRNAVGQPVGQFKLTATQQQVTGVFDMTPLAAGLYTVEIISAGVKSYVKVVKE
jgi:hypothetical protein